MIIAFSGYAGSGKDTAAKLWIDMTAVESKRIMGRYIPIYEVRKFADKLKQVAALMLNLEYEYVCSDEFKKAELPAEWMYEKQTFELDEHGKDGFTLVSMSGREFLQKLGTDAVRNGLHTNAWVNALMAEYRPDNMVLNKTYSDLDLPNWLITDLRFPNEMAAIKNRGGITIRINRYPQFMDQDSFDAWRNSLHESETALDDAQFDYVVENSGTIEQLAEKLKPIIDKVHGNKIPSIHPAQNVRA